MALTDPYGIGSGSAIIVETKEKMKILRVTEEDKSGSDDDVSFSRRQTASLSLRSSLSRMRFA
jgi:hypothetical protein